MKMSYVRVGFLTAWLPRSIVLYDSEMKAGSQLGNLSLLMKGEVIAEGGKWEGSPAQPIPRFEKESSKSSNLPHLTKGKTLPLWVSWIWNPKILAVTAFILGLFFVLIYNDIIG